jgi:hypothetical protein
MTDELHPRAAADAAWNAQRLGREAKKAKGNGHDKDPARPLLRITDPTKFQDQPIPSRRWSVADWIPSGFVTGLYGPSGTGKTLIAQQLMTAAATKNHWVGLQTTPLRSLAVFCEDDDDELHRRQADINQFYDIDFCDLDDMRWLARLGEDNILMRFDSRGGAELTHSMTSCCPRHSTTGQSSSSWTLWPIRSAAITTIPVRLANSFSKPWVGWRAKSAARSSHAPIPHAPARTRVKAMAIPCSGTQRFARALTCRGRKATMILPIMTRGS